MRPVVRRLCLAYDVQKGYLGSRREDEDIAYDIAKKVKKLYQSEREIKIRRIVAGVTALSFEKMCRGRITKR